MQLVVVVSEQKDPSGLSKGGFLRGCYASAVVLQRNKTGSAVDNPSLGKVLFHDSWWPSGSMRKACILGSTIPNKLWSGWGTSIL